MPPGNIARTDQDDSNCKRDRSFPPVRLHLPLNSHRVLAYLEGGLLTLLSVYLVWVLILLGVELTHVLVTGAEPTHVRDALRIVLALSRTERASLPELSDSQGIPTSESRRILAFLRVAKLVEGDKSRGWALTRSSEEITVAAVADAIERSRGEAD